MYLISNIKKKTRDDVFFEYKFKRTTSILLIILTHIIMIVFFIMFTYDMSKETVNTSFVEYTEKLSNKKESGYYEAECEFMNRYNNAYDDTYDSTYNYLTDEFDVYHSYQQGYNDGYYGKVKNIPTYDTPTDSLPSIIDILETE